MIETIIVANTAEAFEQLLRKVAQSGEGARRIRHELTLSQRAYFYGGDNKIVITPHPIPEPLMRHNAALCGFVNVRNVCPAKPNVALSKAVTEDVALINLLVKVTSGKNTVAFLPYAAVPAFWCFLEVMRKAGINAIAEQNSIAFPGWVLEYLDSKLGFRVELQKLIAKHRDIMMPEGFVARNLREAMNMAEWFYAQDRSAVIKVNFGESGWGLWVLRSRQYLDIAAARREFRFQISSDLVWKNTLLVVEEYIDPNVTVAGGSPSVELFVSNKGPTITYCCGQMLDREQFFGIEMGKDVLSARAKNALVNIATNIGKKYHALGYRGFCDIDFVVAKNGDLYAVETNPRRTGGTHVYDLAKRLFGDAWERDRYFLSHDSFQYGDLARNPESLLKALEPLLFPIRGEKRGVIVTSINPTDPVLGYVIIEMNKRRGRKLQQRMFDLFGSQ